MPTKKTKSRKAKLTASDMVLERGREFYRDVKKHASSKPGYDTDKYRALLGFKTAPKNAYLASAIPPRAKAALAMHQGIAKTLRREGMNAYLATAVLPIPIRIERIELDILEARKLRRDWRKCGIEDAMSVVGIAALPADNKRGFTLHPKITMIGFGEGLESAQIGQLPQLICERLDTDDVSIDVQSIEATQASIAGAAAALFDVTEGDKERLSRMARDLGVKKWERRRPLRSFCRHQALSLACFKLTCIAIGDGERLIEKAIVDGKHSLRRMWKEPAPIIHRDEIARFHAAELVRLGMTSFELPFIKVR